MAHKNKSNLSSYRRGEATRGRRGRHRQPAKIYSGADAHDRLADLFRNHGFPDLGHDKIDQFVRFYELLMEKQKTLNLTRLLTLRDVGIKHFVDCLMVPKLTALQFPLLDLGTGPGFPGIPLKIVFPEEKIILAEGVQKRVEFLKDVREALDLKNLLIVGRNINPWFFYPVRGVITRAVEDVGNTLQNVIHCLQTGGHAYFMKGPNVDLELEQLPSEVSQYYEKVQDTAYTLPNTDQKRRLLVYKKIHMAPFPDLEDEPWPGEDQE